MFVWLHLQNEFFPRSKAKTNQIKNQKGKFIESDNRINEVSAGSPHGMYNIFLLLKGKCLGKWQGRRTLAARCMKAIANLY